MRVKILSLKYNEVERPILKQAKDDTVKPEVNWGRNYWNVKLEIGLEWNIKIWSSLRGKWCRMRVKKYES